MRLAELSKRSGVSTASIKHYLRAGLLPPGRRIGSTTAEYDDSHVHRLRLIRALIHVGRLPVATVREVLRHVDDDSLSRAIRMGAALWALPQVPEPDPEDEAVIAARDEVHRLLDAVGWTTAQELSSLSPTHRALVAALATLLRLGYPLDAELLVPYAELMHQVAVRDLDSVEAHPTDEEKTEMVVAGALLFDPVLQALLRLAREEEAVRRYGL
ncbi:transcriptional regulator [Wenjunlia vitaminophila]|uniref:Transcriptional regulator n=1 Tax=Wenjunlia vitaminophila TaxID=76728 RepID=A0A0T6LXN7_WENVI|nr:MerR family transcriptional regulator [Wenjunlia vitaminophila]KRV50810.1 transcriptional regulator [Wenjunlia vitaminophila]